ncbi:MAG: hypothetical protein IK018_04500 [Lachnospiraceae bacterium]|nr:hypothetical protein [Lachnospiraceae bacterium]
MKKRVLSLFTLSMIVLLSGCGKTVSEPEDTVSVIGESVEISAPVSESVEEPEEASVSEEPKHHYAFSEEEDIIGEACRANIDMGAFIDEFGVEPFKDPVTAVKTAFPCMKDKDAEYIKAYEHMGYVVFAEGEDVLSVEVFVVTKTEDGECLYFPYYADNTLPEAAIRTNEEFAKITSADFENALDYDTFYKIAMDEKEDIVSENLYLVKESEDGKAQCYGLTHADGSIIKMGDYVAPVYYEALDFRPMQFLTVEDYDNDGEDECAFTFNSGHGTGYYVDSLFIVDPGEEKPVSFFMNDADMTSSYGYYNYGENIYYKVGYEYDETTAEMSFWLDKDGKKINKGSFTYDEEYAKMGNNQLCFGDQLRFISDGKKLSFEAAGGFYGPNSGWVDYVYSLILEGELTYKDGVIKVKNLNLYCEHSEN